jgi:hypothetical protein
MIYWIVSGDYVGNLFGTRQGLDVAKMIVAFGLWRVSKNRKRGKHVEESWYSCFIADIN